MKKKRKRKMKNENKDLAKQSKTCSNNSTNSVAGTLGFRLCALISSAHAASRRSGTTSGHVYVYISLVLTEMKNVMADAIRRFSYQLFILYIPR
jgi:hypothetical protein